MLKLELTKVMNFEGAMRGMRNPLESWSKSMSYFIGKAGLPMEVASMTKEEYQYCLDENLPFVVGDTDSDLGSRLSLAGSDHGKFLRQIFVCVDITAPLYWWKEFDTYKVATVANSTSTMHKLGSKGLVMEDFSWDMDEDDIKCDTEAKEELDFRLSVVERLNSLIKQWKSLQGAVKDTTDRDMQRLLRQRAKRVWRRMIQDLPSSFNQTRTVTMNYENLRNMFFARKNHKLSEWHTVCHWIEALPHSYLIKEPRLSAKEKQQAELISAISTSVKEAHTIINEVKPTMFIAENNTLVNALMDVEEKLLSITNLLQSPDPTAN